MKRHLAAVAVTALLVLSGCASLAPRFSPEVANAFARDEMRKLETRSVELYYPAHARAAALRTLDRLDRCLERLRKLPITRRQRPRLLVYMTSAEYNNAYVYPQVSGMEEHMLLPQHLSLEMFNWFELGLTEVGDVSCHEAVHYVQMQQVDGFWDVVNVVGGNIFSPNAAMETWFLEGLATYYEGRLGSPIGRTYNPIWRGIFLSGIAARGGDLAPGDLNPQNRELLPFGGNYLTGMHFVEFLARKYGEKRLWRLVDVQGRSVFSPFLLSFRFYEVYRRHIGTLLAEFRDSLRAELKDRRRPGSQTVLDPRLGYLARIASSRADGAIATLTADRDEVVMLRVREADGTSRFARGVTPILFGRPFIGAHPLQVSGLSFSPDGRAVYLVTSDIAQDGAEMARLLQFDAHTGALLRQWELGPAVGGAATPDGAGYLIVELSGQDANLARLDLASGQREPLTRLSGTSLGNPEPSPDGKRIAFAQRTVDSFEIFLREEDGTLVRLTRDSRFDYFPRWIDDGHLLFLREVDGRMQVHVMDLATGAATQVTDAPFVAFDPVPLRDGRVAFLNREGWSWTLDTVPLPAVEAVVDPPSPSKLDEDARPEDGAPAVAPGPEQLASAPPAGPAGSAPPTAPPSAGLPEGATDTPYSPTDHLFWPSLHVPWLSPTLEMTAEGSVRLGAILGASLEGSDRLGMHTWAINASYDTTYRTPSISAAYGNYQLAPWFLSAGVSRQAQRNIVELQGSLTASRPFWTTPLVLGLEAMQHTEYQSGQPVLSVRMVGPGLATEYFAGASTPYGGYRYGLGVGLAATAYPRALGSSFDMADLSLELEGYVPLPVLERHSLRLTARGRMLPGAPVPLLQVGGVPRGLSQPIDGTPGERGPDFRLPGGLSFVEPLRGYEDHALRATRVAIAGARYRYPFIIDRGSASLLYLFPSFFLRQIDVEGFAEGAYTDAAAPLHRAAGGAVLVRMLFGSVLPVTLYYQYAHRFDDGLRGFHLVGMTFE